MVLRRSCCTAALPEERVVVPEERFTVPPDERVVVPEERETELPEERVVVPEVVDRPE